MPYESYADVAYYGNTFKGRALDPKTASRYLLRASRHIDSLTYNRIVACGFDNLTPFQRDVIREVCCLQAEFEYENADEIDTILSAYSINGVSAKFGDSWNVSTEKGVAMKRDVYAYLSQTGLCCRLAI